MKQFLQILILICLFQAENYAQSIAEEGNKWNIAVYPTFSPNTSSYSVLIGEDTIVNNIKYNKVYYSNDSLNTNWEFRNQLLRQDSTKKVFIREYNNDEFLLYDFNLNLNDTFIVEEFCTLIVTDIDSVSLNNNEKRKRLKIEMKDNPNWGTQYWVEGIGSNFGMISHFGFCYFDYSDGFLCFYDNEELLYPEFPPSCFITAIEEIIENEIEIFPNPTLQNLTIINTEPYLTRFNIYNLTGELILSGQLYPNRNNIDLGNFEQGLFTIVLGNKHEFKYSKRILKIK